jgi:hypothetical protein
MSITNDIRTYADTVVAEGRKVLDSTLSTAQAQLNDVTGQANEFVGKATSAAQDLRTSAEKAVNVDAIKAAVEPYLDQVSAYQATVQERAEAIFAELKKDPRLAKAFLAADAAFEVVVETVQERVVKPVVAFTGRGQDTASKSTPRPAAKTTTAKTGTAKTGTAKTTPAKTTTAKTTTAKTTAAKTTAPKTAATPKTAAAQTTAARKPATTKPAAKKATAARKAPAKSTPQA